MHVSETLIDIVVDMLTCQQWCQHWCWHLLPNLYFLLFLLVEFWFCSGVHSSPICLRGGCIYFHLKRKNPNSFASYCDFSWHHLNFFSYSSLVTCWEKKNHCSGWLHDVKYFVWLLHFNKILKFIIACHCLTTKLVKKFFKLTLKWAGPQKLHVHT